MCDVIQVIHAHKELQQEILANLRKGGRLVVVYQHHQMKIFDKVEGFIRTLKESPSFKLLLETSTTKEPQFPEDNNFEGNIDIRSQIYMYVFERV